jgi:hypothetical protein
VGTVTRTISLAGSNASITDNSSNKDVHRRQVGTKIEPIV